MNNRKLIKASCTQAVLERLYYRRPGWRDGTSMFYRLIAERLNERSIVLDIGAGHGKKPYVFERSHHLLVGIDIDGSISMNRRISVGVQGDAVKLPFRAGSIDLAFADYVVEHLPDPERAVREIARVLRPGGHFMFRTPNLFHYVTFVSCVTPHWVHRSLANQVRGISAEQNEDDIFPTYYRLNTQARVRRVCEQAGLRVQALLMVEREPIYLMFSRVCFLLGYLYERLVNCSGVFDNLRSNIFVVAHKPLPESSAVI